MEMTSWLALAAICVMGAISPGPSLALIIRNTVQGGQGHGVATALGHGLGVGIYALITALGLAILITQTPLLFDLIRYGGAAFLAWLGRQIFAWQDGSTSSLGKVKRELCSPSNYVFSFRLTPEEKKLKEANNGKL